eukprot:265245-Amphidinium_carterae.2
MMLGNHCLRLRGQSTWQSTVALSSGESEYYAVVRSTVAHCRHLLRLRVSARSAGGREAGYASGDPVGDPPILAITGQGSPAAPALKWCLI